MATELPRVNGGTEVLDILFDSDGLLQEVSQFQPGTHISGLNKNTTTMPVFSLGDLDSCPDDFLSFLDNPDLGDGDFELFGDLPRRQNSNNSDTTTISTYKTETAITDLDHDYSRRLLSTSDSGVVSDNPVSPQYSDTTDSAYSGGSSPLPVTEDQVLKNDKMETELFQTLDPSCLMDTEDMLAQLAADTNFTLDLDDMDSQMMSDDKSSLHDDQSIMFDTSETGDTLPFHIQDINPNITHQSTKYPELRLSDEEKELLAREGIELPPDMPLTRDEEKALKSVRRKIRNKISAKESRKRKMNYVDGLEQRVKHCTSHNLQLQKKVNALEKQNVTLISNLKKLQRLITNTTNKTAQTSTCVMVLLLSFALLVVPNINPFTGNSQQEIPAAKDAPYTGNSRSLKSDTPQVYMVDNTNIASHAAAEIASHEKKVDAAKDSPQFKRYENGKAAILDETESIAVNATNDNMGQTDARPQTINNNNNNDEKQSQQTSEGFTEADKKLTKNNENVAVNENSKYHPKKNTIPQRNQDL